MLLAMPLDLHPEKPSAELLVDVCTQKTDSNHHCLCFSAYERNPASPSMDSVHQQYRDESALTRHSSVCIHSIKAYPNAGTSHASLLEPK